VSGPAILVAGGAGYIGAHTCLRLAAAGYLPVTLDNLATGHREAVKWGPLAVGDIRDVETVGALVRQHDIKAAIHFAAYSLVAESVADPVKYFDNNVGAGSLFLGALADAGVEAVVFSSTASVYGVPERSPVAEDAAKAPINPYGASKLAVEGLLAALAAAGKMRHTSLRYFNAAGAAESGEIGEAHDPETHLIPNLLAAARPGARPMTLFGSDYPTPDGTAVRDYVHVIDLADVHILALRRLLEGGDSQAWNVGSGEGASNRQVLTAAERVLGRPIPHTVGPRRAGDPPALVADPSRLKAALGWTPKLSDLDSIIATAARWHGVIPSSPTNSQA
jgi:UDP-glucose 4-epimerase/UDP-arabinose 4-epimerase